MLGLGAFALLTAAAAQDRATKVLNDRARVEASGFWLYNDLPQGFERARKSGKPLLVVFRCIPCEHCAQLDERVVERDAAIQDLLKQFVCVRIVHANGLDLSLFQFDYDQSWAAFFLNADRTIYGRYGTRSHRTESENDVTVAGFGEALRAALELHRQYPKNKAALAGKQSAAAEAPVPEEIPSLRGRYGPTLDYGGKVVQSCIHCHQVGEALRLTYRAAGKPIPDPVLFPYPHPKVLGLVMDPATRTTVKSVRSGSSGEKDGFRPGDEIVTLGGQPILSTADIQWVLHHAGSSGSLKADVRRGGRSVPLTLTLTPGWRRSGDISWRATSWDLRRMAAGGLVFEEASADERRGAGLADSALALRVKQVGQYGAHAVGKQAGFQQGDIVLAVDGHAGRMAEGNLLAYLLQQKRPGDRVPFTVLRNGQRIELTLPMQ
jgi:serine protease Do